MGSGDNEAPNIQFKKKKKAKSLRKREALSDDNEKVEEIKITQKLSERSVGVDIVSLTHARRKRLIRCVYEKAALHTVPEHLRQSLTICSKEMLSNQILFGIPEVDLGIEVKICNIEAIEQVKLKLLWNRHRKKKGPSRFAPTNMAVNFVQHNRFNIRDSDFQKLQQEIMHYKRKHDTMINNLS